MSCIAFPSARSIFSPPLLISIIQVTIFGHIPGFPHFYVATQPLVSLTKLLPAHYLRQAMDMHYFRLKQPLDICLMTLKGYGDVGVLSNMNEFLFTFNIFLPADHCPYNKNNTPDSFSPLDPLNDSKICTTVNYLPCGSVIYSKQSCELLICQISSCLANLFFNVSLIPRTPPSRSSR